MWWWIVAAILLIIVVRFLWRAYTQPAHVLGRQAANMNWVVSGNTTDERGYRNMRVKRDGLEAMITYEPATVVLLTSPRQETFRDFIELERWLATAPSTSAQDSASGATGANGEVRFDPRILQDFEKEIAAWPEDQARTALLVLRSAIQGDRQTWEKHYGDLTVAQLRSVGDVLRRITGD
jgi:hypothetical protein